MTVLAPVQETVRWLVARTRAAVRRRFRALISPGDYRFADAIDSDGQGHGPVTLRYRLAVSENRIELDTGDNDDQVPGPVNFSDEPHRCRPPSSPRICSAKVPST